MAQSSPNGPKWPTMTQEWPKVIQNDPKLSQMAQKWRPDLRIFSAIFFYWKGGSANFSAFRMYAFGMHYMLEPIYYRLCLQPMSVNYDFTFQGGIGGSYLDLFELSNLPYSACPRECPAINSPVCGLNGKTYGSKCLLRRVSIFFFRKYWKNYKWMNTIDVYIFVLTCQNLISVSKATSL